jgi:hypothetical protein
LGGSTQKGALQSGKLILKVAYMRPDVGLEVSRSVRRLVAPFKGAVENLIFYFIKLYF